jgi:hypothetical protein
MLNVLVCLALASSADGAPSAEPSTTPAKPVAVVELFTSEGCSSCPPADELLADLVREHEHKGDLLALSFHIDYWDRLGWKDPWSSAPATARQQEYAGSLARGNLYTPQMIVGGTREFVGSDRARAKKEIETELARIHDRSPALRASWDPSAAGALRITIEAQPGATAAGRQAPSAHAVVALVERALTSDVRRGENAGRKLSHENVVRVFETVSLDSAGRGQTTLKAPKDVQAQNASIIVFLQDQPGRPILAGASIPLPPAPAPAPAPARQGAGNDR